MGVVTIAYSVEPKMMKKVRADNEKFAFIFGECEDESEHWEVESYDFDTGIDAYIQIFRGAGFTKTAKSIDSEYADLDIFDYNGYDIWVIPPSGVKVICKEIEKATFETLKAKELSEITDRRGTKMQESLIESYLSDIEGIKNFLGKTLEKGNYLLFSEA